MRRRSMLVPRLGALRRQVRKLRRETPVLAALMAAIVLVVSLTTIFSHEASLWCLANPFACGMATNLLATALLAALGYFWLFGRRRQLVMRKYLSGVTLNPSLSGDIAVDTLAPAILPSHRHVRDDVITELAAGAGGPPLLIVGEGGSGKSTFASALVGHLIREDILPVPFSVRGLSQIDINALARERFISQVDIALKSTDEGEAIWRRARRGRRIVALIDGLDEFAPDLLRTERDTAIASAMLRARAGYISVVATARPNTVPKDIEATILELPSLDAEAAVHYASHKTVAGLSQRNAKFVRQQLPPALKLPFYLDLVAELNDTGESLEAPDDVNLVIELDILDRYICALTDARLRRNLELPPLDRQQAIDRLSWAAAAMLFRKELNSSVTDIGLALEQIHAPDHSQRSLLSSLEAGGSFDLVSASPTGSRIRFRHSIVQSYLASRACASSDGLWKKLIENGSSPESLNAIAMLGAQIARTDRDTAAAMCGEVMDLVPRTMDADERLALTSCAADIAIAIGRELLFRSIADAAGEIRVNARRNGKLAIVDRLSMMTGSPAVNALWAYACDDDFLVRWTAAKVLAALGPQAHTYLAQEFALILEQAEAEPPSAVQRSLPLGVLGWVLPGMCRQRGVAQGSLLADHLGRLLAIAERNTDPLLLEVSLARGIKMVALAVPAGPMDPLAIALLESPARYWYSRICLVHAIAIRIADGSDPENGGLRRLEVLMRRDPHPYVREAARLCLRGIDRHQHYSTYIWENEVVEVQFPSRTLSYETLRLLGDVSLLSNLVYTSRSFINSATAPPEYALWATGPDLPVCLGTSGDRSELFNGCSEHCEFGLCSAANGNRRHGFVYDRSDQARSDFSEAFCRLQVAAAHRASSPASYSAISRRKHIQFWRTMERTRSAQARHPQWAGYQRA